MKPFSNLNILYVNFHSPKVNNFVLKVLFIILINILQFRRNNKFLAVSVKIFFLHHNCQLSWLKNVYDFNHLNIIYKDILF